MIFIKYDQIFIENSDDYVFIIVFLHRLLTEINICSYPLRETLKSHAFTLNILMLTFQW